MPRNMASKQDCRADRLLHMPCVRAKNKPHKGAKYTNQSAKQKYPRIVYMIFGMSCLLIIMAACIGESGNFLAGAIFSLIGLSGLGYVAWMCGRRFEK